MAKKTSSERSTAAPSHRTAAEALAETTHEGALPAWVTRFGRGIANRGRVLLVATLVAVIVVLIVLVRIGRAASLAEENEQALAEATTLEQLRRLELLIEDEAPDSPLLPRVLEKLLGVIETDTDDFPKLLERRTQQVTVGERLLALVPPDEPGGSRRARLESRLAGWRDDVAFLKRQEAARRQLDKQATALAETAPEVFFVRTAQPSATTLTFSTGVTLAESAHTYASADDADTPLSRALLGLAGVTELRLEPRQVTLTLSAEADATYIENATVQELTDRYARVFVTLRTEAGPIRLELFSGIAPNAVANFLYQVRQGYYRLDGPGNEIARLDAAAATPTRLEFGAMPAGASFDEIHTRTERGRRIDPRWKADIERHNLGYGLPVAPAAFEQLHTFGTLALKLVAQGAAPNPRSGSVVCFLNLKRNTTYDRRHPIFGQLRTQDPAADPDRDPEAPRPWDAESLQTIAAIGANGVAVLATQIERVLGGRVERVFVRPRQSGIARSVPDGDDNGENENGNAGAQSIEFEPVAPELLRADPTDPGAYRLAGPLSATHVRLTPGLFERFAKGASYRDAGGAMQTPEKQTEVPLFSIDETERYQRTVGLLAVPVWGSAPGWRSAIEAFAEQAYSRVVPRFRDRLDPEGTPLADQRLPRVLYDTYPIPRPIQATPPTKKLPEFRLKDPDAPDDGDGAVPPPG